MALRDFRFENSPEVPGAWSFCPVGGKRHGIMTLEKNENGGLYVKCVKCYVEPKRRKNRGAK